ncbi:MAG: hypothetical protein M3457_16650 [Chloroflexota bacterium]|nr:hypothetical protein [Chloroflexota bacterium]
MGRTDLDYIGQTGTRLGQRLGMLAGALADEMPYRDPHTAAPALWALRHAERCSFDVSVAVVEGTTPWRKGLEALAIGLYRQEHGRSPTVEFGRIPSAIVLQRRTIPGWRNSGSAFEAVPRSIRTSIVMSSGFRQTGPWLDRRNPWIGMDMTGRTGGRWRK